jgi:hypothetical protein
LLVFRFSLTAHSPSFPSAAGRVGGRSKAPPQQRHLQPAAAVDWVVGENPVELLQKLESLAGLGDLELEGFGDLELKGLAAGQFELLPDFDLDLEDLLDFDLDLEGVGREPERFHAPDKAKAIKRPSRRKRATLGAVGP